MIDVTLRPRRHSSTKRRRCPGRVRPSAETLEARALLSGGTITVSNDPHRPADYATIQAAVDHAGPGTTVLVYPGTYHEQVTIPAADMGLTLQSQKSQAAVIAPPATITGNGALVEDQATGVTITGFTITGPGPAPAGSLRSGILVDMAGSATISGNRITKIADSPMSVAQTTIAITIGGALPGGMHTTGSATITRNVIDGYQKAGIVVDGAGSSAEIDQNQITGAGPTNVIAQNGIQISSGAAAVVQKNVITGNVYSPQTYVATGILLVNPGSVTIAQNTLGSNDVGIYDDGSTGTVMISRNNVTGSTFDGIDVVNASGVTVDRNTTSNNTLDGILLLGSATGNTISRNNSNRNGHDGIEVDVTAVGNTFDRNSMDKNAVFDAQDYSVGSGTAGTANTWVRNRGKTSSPPGLVQ